MLTSVIQRLFGWGRREKPRYEDLSWPRQVSVQKSWQGCAARTYYTNIDFESLMIRLASDSFPLIFLEFRNWRPNNDIGYCPSRIVTSSQTRCFYQANQAGNACPNVNGRIRWIRDGL
jgi:hypothetical protein